MQRAIEMLMGWCKDCGEVRPVDRELGCCEACGSPHVSAFRPVEEHLVAEAA